MPTSPYQNFRSPYLVLNVDNVDTDQIIPARYLKTTERSGLGLHAFNDWRYDASGVAKPDFVLNSPTAARAKVLVAGNNFGCGSSREHAVWALMGAGLTAIVSTDFADIFRGNSLGNGLLPIQVPADVVAELVAAAASGDEPEVSVDLPSQTLTLPSGRAVKFPVPSFAKHCMEKGVDELDVLLDAGSDIGAYEAAHPEPFTTAPVGASV